MTECTACRAPRVPGVPCPACGEPEEARPLPDYYPPPALDPGTCVRACDEARALEYAGDLDGALAIYERLATARTLNPVPYQRASVIYRKRKAWADEERVVRLALAHIPCGPTSWFVLRLAKILGEQKKPHR